MKASIAKRIAEAKERIVRRGRPPKAKKAAKKKPKPKRRKLSPEHKRKLLEARRRVAEAKRAANAPPKKLYGVEREPWKKETRGVKKKKYKRKTYIARRPKAVGYVVIDDKGNPLENILDPYGDTPRMKILLLGGSQATLFKSREMAQRAIKVTTRYAEKGDLKHIWKPELYEVVRLVH